MRVREHPPLHHHVLPRGDTEPLGAELRDPLLRLEVHVDYPEAVAIPVDPLEVVLRTPEEVPIHRHALGRRTLKLGKTGAQEHHTSESYTLPFSATTSEAAHPFSVM